MKRTIFYTLFAALLLFCFNTRAQNFSLGIKGGISIPDLSAGSGNQNPLNTGYSSRQGPDGAVFAEFKFSDLFSLEPMVEYSSQGGKKDGLQALATPSGVAELLPQGYPVPQYLYANYNSEAKLNYIMIPVLAKVGHTFGGSAFRIYIDAGPFVGLLVAAHQVTSGQSELYLDAAGQQPLQAGTQDFNSTTDIKSQLNTINVGVEGNVGVSYNIGKSSIFVEGGGNYGFLNIQKNAQDGKNETGAATADIGYSYAFGK